jgi:mitotic spindle assembly checkpoint protein MAD2
MLAQTTAQSAITLAGSATIVVDYLNHAVNGILYQRGLYAAEDFSTCRKYGLTLMQTSDPALQKYLSRLFSQLERACVRVCRSLDHVEWLVEGAAEKCVLVVQSLATKTVMERWTFHFRIDEDSVNGDTYVIVLSAILLTKVC